MAERQRISRHPESSNRDNEPTISAHPRLPKRLSQGITIRLAPETLEKLRTQADEMGIGPTTLARIWILEHLRASVREPADARHVSNL